ncbi:MAG: paraslipin, partial [Cyanobacteria bacterium J06560_5]
MNPFVFLMMMIIGGGAVASKSVRIVNQSDEALVETLGRYSGKKLTPGMNFTVPFVQRVVFKETVREKVLDVPPQQC